MYQGQALVHTILLLRNSKIKATLCHSQGASNIEIEKNGDCLLDCACGNFKKIKETSQARLKNMLVCRHQAGSTRNMRVKKNFDANF